jgi:CxxC motif-containing protein (DUF1111 family)
VQKLQRWDITIAAKMEYENAIYRVSQFSSRLNVITALLISPFFTFVVLQMTADFDFLTSASLGNSSLQNGEIEMTKYVRRWSVAGIATMLLGATALSGPAFGQAAQNAAAPDHRCGVGGCGGGGGGTGGKTLDPGPRGGPPGAGGAIPGLSPPELAFFTAATDVFNEVEAVTPNGLGPRFNLDSCGGCHAFPQAGGSSPATNPQVAVATANGGKNTVPSFITQTGPIREVRFVRNPDGTPDGGVHDLFVITGRTDLANGATNTCNIQQPDFAAAVAANNAIFRIPTPTFGLGFIEAVTDTSLQATFAAAAQQKRSLGISGSFNRNGNDGTITRFGWKAQNKSLWIFAAEAYNVEMGITNLGFPNEREENPACQFTSLPESTTNFTDQSKGVSLASGISDDVTNFAAFMRFLAPPTPATSTTPAAASTSGTQVAAANASTAIAAAASSTSSTSTTSTSSTLAQGQQAFTNVGCAACHIMNQTTGKSVITGVSNQTVQPFSDFAVHNMGTGLQDRVSQGLANGQQFRTAPLWGVGQRLFFLHDGRTNDIYRAIQEHASQGSEANGVIRNFNTLSLSDQQAVVNFLRSL